MTEKTTRSSSSAKNALVSLIYYFISNVFTFIMRTFLINNIGIEYARTKFATYKLNRNAKYCRTWLVNCSSDIHYISRLQKMTIRK